MKYFLLSLVALCTVAVQILPAQTHDAKFTDLPQATLFGGVNAVTTDDTYIYIGGRFSTIGASTRNNLARYNKNTGALDAWNPNLNNNVRSIVVDGGFVYIGGEFTDVGGTTRNRLAKISVTTGNVDPTWNPNVNSSVEVLRIDGDDVYIGGDFTDVGGITRNRVAKLNKNTGALDAWNPSVNANVVEAIEIDGNDIYIGGSFSGANSIGTTTRNRIAKLNKNTAVIDGTFVPNPDNIVYEISVQGNDVYIGGNFTNIDATARNRVAKLNKNTGVVDAWNPNADGGVREFTFSSSHVYIGGEFTNIGGVARNYLAKVSLADGTLDASFNASFANGSVGGNGDRSVLLENDVLYVGGNFDTPTNYFFVTNVGTSSTTIPTVGEWAMIVLALSLFCVAVMYVRKPALSFIGSAQHTGNASMFLGKDDFVFNAKLFFPLSFVVTAVVWAVCVYFHETAVRDMIGTGVTGIVGGYLLMLLATLRSDND